MRTLTVVPNGLDAIVEKYGEPYDPDFQRDHLRWYRAPFRMRLSWQPETSIGGFVCHHAIGLVVMDTLKEVLRFGGLAYLQENDLDLFGGCYNPRGKRGGKGTSTHAWGIAVDWCPALGPMGGPTRMPDFIVTAFESRGFTWGGRWARPDGMHFQAAEGY